jgi:hypothetical protein
MPPLVMVALPLLALHTPPLTDADSVISDDTHTIEGPLITPAESDGLIVMALVAVALPQLLVTVYLTVSGPTVLAITTPPPDMVAFVLDMLHTPPPTDAVYVAGVPMHTVAAPVTVPALGAGFTLSSKVVAAVPQVLVMVYDMMVVPPATPVTTPVPDTVAAVGLVLLHTPPAVAFDRAVNVPAHIVPGPMMVPAFGERFTVTVCIAATDPQLLVTR